MRFMNEPEIEEAVRQRSGHPVLGPATRTLSNLMTWVNGNSDGWPYWAAPVRAAEKLMELIVRDGTARYVFDDVRADATADAYRAALRPVKAFRTRHGADFEIVELAKEPGPIRWRKAEHREIAALGCWQTVPASTGDELPLIRVVSWSKADWHVQHRQDPDLSFAGGWRWADVIVPETGPGAAPGYMTTLEASTAQEARALAEQHWGFIAPQARGLLAEGLAEIEARKQAPATTPPPPAAVAVPPPPRAPSAGDDRDALRSLLGEGIHTGLRKASGHPEAHAAWAAIDRLPAEEWDAVLGFVIAGLYDSGYRLSRGRGQ